MHAAASRRVYARHQQQLLMHCALCTLTPNVQQQGLKIKVRKARRGTIVGGETPGQTPFDISLQAQCGLSFSATTMDTGHLPLSSTIEIKMVSSLCGGDTRYCPTLWRLGWLLDLFRVFLQGFLFSRIISSNQNWHCCKLSSIRTLVQYKTPYL